MIGFKKGGNIQYVPAKIAKGNSPLPPATIPATDTAMHELMAVEIEPMPPVEVLTIYKNESTVENVVTSEMKSQWKRKHRDGVFELTVAGFTGYLRMPTDKEMIKFCTASNEANHNGREAGRKFLKMLWLGGDKEIITNDMVLDQTENKLIKLVKAKEAQILKRNGIYN